MIRINRPAAPGFLTDPKQKWCEETERAKAHYLNGTEKAFEFKMYNDQKLKDELRQVFVKCAYCESSYGAVYDGDVEHFRPKGRIKEKMPQTPGYYWLANDWDNLFLACQHCNQRRKHILYGEEELEGYGKLDQFPLDPEDKRLAGPDSALDGEEEARLLIDPCKDDPDQHLAYERSEGVVQALTPKGEASIKVYVLQRPLLVIERKKKLLKLYAQMARVVTQLERLNSDPANASEKQALDNDLDALLEFGNPDEPYAGMCRYFIRTFLRENDLR